MARSRRRELLCVVGAAVVGASLASHGLSHALGLRTQAVLPMRFPGGPGAKSAVAAGSSLTFYGVDWSRVATNLHADMTGLGVPGGSVREEEVLQRTAPPAAITFVGVSVYDLNENYVSEFRADVVPFWEEVSRLWAARDPWPRAKRVLSQYPMKYVRLVFPTAGRSISVMVGLRERLRHLVGRRAAESAPDRAVLGALANGHTESISSWSPARMRRNLADASAVCGKTDFHSTKQAALVRLLRRAATQGPVVVLVMPESPAFRAEFVGSDVQRRFEDSLSEVRPQVPEAHWIRLDRAPDLGSNELYWDLIHLNATGQALATGKLLAELAALCIP